MSELKENTQEESSSKEFALKIFNCSPLKKEKLNKLLKHSYSKFDNKVCLDIGSDNGVISYLLRQRGGSWYSADLIPETVDSIKELVGKNVFSIQDGSTSFNDSFFDLVIVVDMLEHLENDLEFVQDLKRISKPESEILINVPSPRKGVLRFIKNKIGQTDAAHGHLRAGYEIDELAKMMGDRYQLVSYEYYQKSFSVFIDMLITFGLEILKGGRSKKGTVVVKSDIEKLKKSFKMFKLVSPIILFFTKLDKLLFFLKGNMLIARFKNNGN